MHYQSLLDFTNIPKLYLVDTLLHEQSNLVIDLLLGPTD